MNKPITDLLREIVTRLESAAAEVDCFNVYEAHDLAKSALAAARVQAIPREPTQEMIDAGEKKRREIMGRGESIKVIWLVMWDASPINALPEKHETED